MNPNRPVPAGFDLKELFAPGGTRWSWLKDREFLTWRNVFLSLDGVAKFWERYGSRRSCAREQFVGPSSGCWSVRSTPTGLGAIYPSMKYAIMALDVLGYAPDHPDRVEAQRQFDTLMVETDESFSSSRASRRCGTRRLRLTRSAKSGCAAATSA